MVGSQALSTLARTHSVGCLRDHAPVRAASALRCCDCAAKEVALLAAAVRVPVMLGPATHRRGPCLVLGCAFRVHAGEKVKSKVQGRDLQHSHCGGRQEGRHSCLCAGEIQLSYAAEARQQQCSDRTSNGGISQSERTPRGRRLHATAARCTVLKRAAAQHVSSWRPGLGGGLTWTM